MAVPLTVAAGIVNGMAGYEYSYLSDPTWFEDAVYGSILLGCAWLCWKWAGLSS
jgi:hypothetical protein